MDKETLSNYGWIVICVLVLAVMIALATPFGDYISTAVKSTTQGLFDTNKNALNSTGLINIGDQSFSDGTGDSGGGNQTTEVKREAGSIIPDGATYTPNGGTAITGNGTNTFPDTPQTGDTYEEGDYKYSYNLNGAYGPDWSVLAKDKTKTEYEAILSEIAGRPITTMRNTFYDCTSLIAAPAIPNSVIKMHSTFKNCTKLTTAPIIPDGVTDMECTFDYCTSLKTYVGSTDIDGDFSNYTLPSSLTTMSSTFGFCSSLIAAPAIPNGVTNMYGAFSGCPITTAPIIPDSVTNMSNTFYNCGKLTTAPAIPSGVINMSQTFTECTLIKTTITIPTSVTNPSGTSGRWTNGPSWIKK